MFTSCVVLSWHNWIAREWTRAKPKCAKMEIWPHMEFDVGFRVIRGVDWVYKDQDGGPGHVGTVISMKSRFTPRCPSSTRLVQWDVGSKGLYRTGRDGAFDLRVLDSGLAEVVHSKVWCDGCNDSEIEGLRWRCTECYGIDLCTDCYMEDKHDIQHVFMRVWRSEKSSMGPKMPPRCSSSFSPIYGFFPGAKIVKFPSWLQREASDTGPGKIVAHTSDTEMEEGCEEVIIEFGDGVRSNVHDVRDGKVYVTAMCTLPGKSGEIYHAHLPNCGDSEEIGIQDKVVLIASLEELRKLQLRRGLPELDAEILGKVGVVTERSEQGNFAVNFTGSRKNVWMNPSALRKLYSYCPGQKVFVSMDSDMVTRLQGDRGGKENEITEFLGKSGKVTKIMNGDIQVKFPGNQRRVFNAACLVPYTLYMPFPDGDTIWKYMAETFGNRMEFRLYPPCLIVHAVMKGDTQLVNHMLDKEPEKVEYEDALGRTLISHAIPCDHATEMVKLLVDRGAFIDSRIRDGHTSLMHAVYHNKFEVVDYLLRHGANVNAVDGEGNSPLHIAVERGHFQSAHYLLLHGADVNLAKVADPGLEGQGSTPLHNAAINSESRTVADMLTARKDTDFKAVTVRRLSLTREGAVHFAARYDNIYVMQRLLDRVPRLSTARTSFGQTALYIAAKHNSLSVAKYLIQQAGCDVNLRDDGVGNTPLMIAIAEVHLDMVEVLLKNGASCNVQNHDNLTSLNVALIGVRLKFKFTPDHARKPFIREMKEKWGREGVKSTADALVAYLVSHGANLDGFCTVTETFREHLRRLRDPILPALETIERERSTLAKQSKCKQKSNGNGKEKASNPRPAIKTSASPGFQRLRNVSEPVTEGGAKLDLADLVRSRQMNEGSETVHKSLGASGSDKPVTDSEGNIPTDGSTVISGGSRTEEVIAKLKTKLRDLEKDVASLHRSLRRFDHLTEMRISFACGHDVIKSVADLIPDCPRCCGKLKGVVLHTRDGSDGVNES